MLDRGDPGQPAVGAQDRAQQQVAVPERVQSALVGAEVAGRVEVDERGLVSDQGGDAQRESGRQHKPNAQCRRASARYRAVAVSACPRSAAGLASRCRVITRAS